FLLQRCVFREKVYAVSALILIFSLALILLISTGPLEGTDNKIKTMKRQAYGIRDMEFFKLKIFAIHRTKYALVG
ncbi:unnamed protein product, partial [marine sediment metagenome]